MGMHKYRLIVPAPNKPTVLGQEFQDCLVSGLRHDEDMLSRRLQG